MKGVSADVLTESYGSSRVQHGLVPMLLDVGYLTAYAGVVAWALCTASLPPLVAKALVFWMAVETAFYFFCKKR